MKKHIFLATIANATVLGGFCLVANSIRSQSYDRGFKNGMFVAEHKDIFDDIANTITDLAKKCADAMKAQKNEEKKEEDK